MIAAIRDAGYRVSSVPVVISPHRIPPPLGSPQVRERVFVLAVRDPQAAQSDMEPLIARRPEPFWSPREWRLGAEYLERTDPGAAYGIREVERTWLTAWDAFVKGDAGDHLPGFPIWVDAWLDRPEVAAETPEWKADYIEKNAAFYRENREFLDSWLTEAWDDDGTTVRQFPQSRRKFEWQARTAHPTRSGRTIWDLLIHLRPSGIRVKPADYFPALVAITQTSIVGELQRRITPREAAKLQGVPYDAFERFGLPDEAIYKQLGNAVNVGVVQYVATALFRRGGVNWENHFNCRYRRHEFAGARAYCQQRRSQEGHAREPKDEYGPRLRVRRLLHARRYRYNVNMSIRLGNRRSVRVDIAFPKRRLAIFVDGCFWHRCPDHGVMPATNTPYWAAKLGGNVDRDMWVDEALADAGWTIVRVWEHESAGSSVELIERAIAACDNDLHPSATARAVRRSPG